MHAIDDRINRIDPKYEEIKNNKSPGGSDITRMLNARGDQLCERLYLLIDLIWKDDKMTADWYKALICPIHKKADKMHCKNDRGI